MSGDEKREMRVEATDRDLAAVHMVVTEHLAALANYHKAATSGLVKMTADNDVEAREHSEALVKYLLKIQLIINRAANHPDVIAGLPSIAEKAERAIRGCLPIAAIAPGATVPTYEELRAEAESGDPLMWNEQSDRLVAYYDRAEELLTKVSAARADADEHGTLLAIAELDDFIEDLDREEDLLGRRDTSELRQMVAGSRDRIAAKASENSSTGHVVARRWTAEGGASG